MYRSAVAEPALPSTGQGAPEAYRPAWRARLSLHFDRASDRTVMVRRAHEGPLTVQKALYPEGRDICHAVILHPPGGIAAGDDLGIDIDVGPRAHALLTTPGATKWYKASAALAASQRIAITLQAGARLDWLPQDNIYFDRSHARQAFTLQLAPDATAIGWDAALLGRQACGETWQHACLRTVTRLVQPDGRPLWEERQVLRSGDAILNAPQGLGGRPAYGTMWAYAPACTPELAQQLAPALPYGGELSAGATALPGGLLLIRAVAAYPEPLRMLFADLWLRLRPLVHGVAARPLRLWST
nr:urease accessory protein UreD [Pseudomonas sp.]